MPGIADLLNSPTALEFEGRTYQLRQPTLAECGEYQRHIEQEARAAAARATELPEDDRRRLLTDTVADIAAGRYRYGGEVCVRSLQTVEGIARLMSIVCRDQGLSYDLALKVCDRHLRECVAILSAQALGDDPKAEAAIQVVLTSLGLPPTFLSSGSSASSTPPSELPTTSPPSAPSPSAK